jgi:hypothetical protein
MAALAVAKLPYIAFIRALTDYSPINYRYAFYSADGFN